jgi:pyridoxamine 5'-phosphate oxidase
VTGKMREMLRGLEVFPAELPEFDIRSAPGDPVTLFLTWLADAVRDKILGPHAMTLATADAAGRVSSRVLICKDVDEAGRWYFASDAASVKGRDLAANPHAAASFYWPRHGRPRPGPRRWSAASPSRWPVRPNSTRPSAAPRPKSTRTPD